MAQGTFNDGDQLSVIRGILNSNANDAETRVSELEGKAKVGFLDYNDLATATTPISVVGGNTVKLTNDGLGAFTNKLYPPDGVTDLWDTTAQSFDFSELSLGAVVHERLDITITVTGANAEVTGEVKLGIGNFPYTLNVFRQYFKNAGTYNITVGNFIYIGDNNTLSGGGEFLVTSSNNTDIVVNGWALAVNIR